MGEIKKYNLTQNFQELQADINKIEAMPSPEQVATKSVNDLVNYYLKSETYTKDEILGLIAAIQQFHYEVYARTSDVTNPSNNVLYLIGPTGTGSDKYEEYVYDSTRIEPWIKIGDTSIDLSGYVTTSDLNTALTDYTTTANLTILLSGKQDVISDLSTIRSGAQAGSTAYQKPITGIPSTDMASGVRSSLDKADSSYQKPSGGIPASDIADGVIPTISTDISADGSSDTKTASPKAVKTYADTKQPVLVSGTNIKTVNGESLLGSGNIIAGDPNAVKYTEQSLTDAQKTQARSNIGAGTYTKAGTGIPSSDMASAVQTSLGKADTAYQKPGTGIPASDLASGVIPTVPTISTDVSADAASDVKTSSPKSVKTYVDAGIAAVESDLSDLEDVVGAIDIGAYVIAWDGNSTPVVANIPTGVTVTYNTTTYTGELAASASTIQKIYLVATGTTDNYDRYITVGDSTYSWVNIGTTEITLADYATQSELDQLEHEVHNLSGKYYGIFADGSELPEGDAVGYAFVGTEVPFAIYQFDGEDWEDSGATIDGIQGEPGENGVGFASVASPTPADGTVEITLSNGDTMTLDLNHNHPGYYSKVAETSNPFGGFLPDVVYSLGTLTGTVTFALAAAVTGNVNHYFWMFDTGSTAPTITWPTGITWAAGAAPTVVASKHYEISILGGVAYYSEV